MTELLTAGAGGSSAGAEGSADGAGGSFDVGAYDMTGHIEEVEECRMRRTKRLCKSAGFVRASAGLAEFGNAMRETQLVRLQIKESNLLLEQRRHKYLFKERAAKREQHAAYRKGNTMKNMGRIKIMHYFSANDIRHATQKNGAVD